jgi:hypothetical protein
VSTAFTFPVEPRAEQDNIVSILHNLSVTEFSSVQCYTADGEPIGYAFHTIIDANEIEMVLAPDTRRVVLTT